MSPGYLWELPRIVWELPRMIIWFGWLVWVVIAAAVLVAAAMMVILARAPVVQAGTNSDSISINFGSDEPTGGNQSMLDPSAVAGVVPSANWNNATTKGGVLAALVRDTNGV